MGVDRLQISSEHLRGGWAVSVVLLQKGRQGPAETVLGEAVGAVMASHAVGREQLCAGFTSVEILRAREPSRQRHDDDRERM